MLANIIMETEPSSEITISLLCRVCLSSEGELSDIFCDGAAFEATLACAIMECAPIQISSGDGMPSLICNVCIERLQKVYQFRSMCIKSDTTLRNYLIQKTPETERMLLDVMKENESCSDRKENRQPLDDIVAQLLEQNPKPVVTETVSNNTFTLFEKILSTNDKTFGDITDHFLLAPKAINKNNVTSLQTAPQQATIIITCPEKEEFFETTDAAEDADNRGRKQKRAFGTSKKKLEYKCDECFRLFAQKSHLVCHKRTHTGEKPFKCEDCGKRFAENSNLLRHKRVHSGEKPYQCQVCGKCCNQKDDLTRHERIHSGEKPYKCDICETRFTVRTSLVQHKRSHTGERPYRCPVCQKCFVSRPNLNKHNRIHTGERPYSCLTCGKRFIQKDNLIKHERIHSGERPYKCEICERRFTVSNHLTEHMRKHTGEKPYCCELCKKHFTTGSSLKKHKKIHDTT